jgi:hypothetical protein
MSRLKTWNGFQYPYMYHQSKGIIKIAKKNQKGTVKSPNFVTAHNFVTAADNFCEALLGFQL